MVHYEGNSWQQLKAFNIYKKVHLRLNKTTKTKEQEKNVKENIVLLREKV